MPLILCSHTTTPTINHYFYIKSNRWRFSSFQQRYWPVPVLSAGRQEAPLYRGSRVWSVGPITLDSGSLNLSSNGLAATLDPRSLSRSSGYGILTPPGPVGPPSGPLWGGAGRTSCWDEVIAGRPSKPWSNGLNSLLNGDDTPPLASRWFSARLNTTDMSHAYQCCFMATVCHL